MTDSNAKRKLSDQQTDAAESSTSKRVRLLDSTDAAEDALAEDGRKAASSPLESRNRYSKESKRGRDRGRGNARQQKGKEARADTWDASPHPTSDNKQSIDDDDKEKRLPKRKVAVLIGYCGTGYSGSQINPGVKTIEGAAFEAFVKAGCVSEDNAVNPAKVTLLRSARTDAGVHAAVNVLSLKLILNPPTLEAPHTLERLVDHLNSYLPEQIRIWRILRVQNSYNPRTFCDSRMYDYCLPTYVFLPPRPGSQMAAKLRDGGLRVNAESADISRSSEADQFWQINRITTTQEEMKAKREWRLQSDCLESLRAAAQLYEGSHNFHNFTVAKDFKDRSAKRVIKSIKVSDPFMAGDCEWLSIKIHGQSFMLHQIRKMVGMLILLVRSKCPSSLIPEAFGPAKIHIPKAPSLGLLLEQPQFDQYNKRVLEANQTFENNLQSGKKGVGESDREAMSKETFEYGQDLMQKIDAFKKTFVYDKMWLDEVANDTYAKFLALIDAYPGPDFLYLNAQGVITPACTFVNGKIPGSASNNLTEEEEEEDKNLAAQPDEG